MDHHVRSAEQQDEVYVVDGGPASSIIRYINHRCARAALPSCAVGRHSCSLTGRKSGPQFERLRKDVRVPS